MATKVPQSQEVMAKAPKGFRPLTDEETKEFRDQASQAAIIQANINQHQAEVNRFEAELELAQTRLALAKRALKDLSPKLVDLNRRLGITRVEDVKEVNGQIWVPEGTTIAQKPEPKLAK